MVGQEKLKKSKNDWRFINSGFNLRPTDICFNCISQLKKLNQILSIRRNNYNLIQKHFFQIVNSIINLK